MKKLVERRYEDIDLETDCATLLDRLNSLIETFDNENIRFFNNGYELEVHVKEIETDKEYTERVEKEEKQVAKSLERKRKQFEKLKVELNED